MVENNAFRVPHRRVWEREGKSDLILYWDIADCITGTAGLLRWLREGL